jgi:peptidase E
MQTNVLLNTYAFHEPWARDTLSPLLKPGMRAAVIAFSFNAGMDEAQAASEGHRRDLLPAFGAYGIGPAHVELVNWFRDTPLSAREKIAGSDIVFLTGGWPDHMMYRLRRWGLAEQLEHFEGIVMGCSAGAMVQIRRYHVTPEADYPSFGWYEGMDMLRDFLIEVHYRETPLQHQSIERVRRETGLPLFALYDNGGLVVRGEEISTMGRTRLFLPNETLHTQGSDHFD